jgi:hypothetical protein
VNVTDPDGLNGATNAPVTAAVATERPPATPLPAIYATGTLAKRKLLARAEHAGRFARVADWT